MKKYKAVLFMNVFKLSEKQRDFIKTKVARDGRTLIWNYLPGYTDGKSVSFKFVNDVTQFETIPFISKEIPVVQIENTTNEYKFEGAINPMVVISDPKAEILARLKNSGQPIVARKTFNNFRSVFSSLPLHNTDFFRKLFKEAGCHIYNQDNDFTYANSGLLMIHTKEGVTKTINLKNQKIISFEMPVNSTWLINTKTGDILLK